LMVLRSPGKFMAMEKVLVDLAVSAFGATLINTSELSSQDVCNTVLGEVYGPSTK
jgi:hypothetical protein